MGGTWQNHYTKEELLKNFVKNPKLMESLANTGNKVLVESVANKLWGTGVPLHKSRCLDSPLWTGHGILGEILSEIRQEHFEQNSLSTTASLPGVTNRCDLNTEMDMTIQSN